ncbi:TIGR02680 family protein [Rossellomorea vietnamensis]|uniref:TIGR02680 family protein n=1 Tax=Rossellomorea vietnamensis TaxID=218284 RepID=UPI001E2F5BB2|nr:TIGR02680 family protein [Rossellomorea vietnamensis]MCC5804115.1 TIGR02680 family protein [Rossellomorea vietnamensis]
MSHEQWTLNRAGLVNFWYYDEETFDFKDGKLLLRGANGSGKSVTMQSFLPVLLDGRKSPDRLDPFGSKARRMEDYLLGEKGIVDRDERTGYLFMEYVKESTGQYVTTGIGMQAKRNKQMKSWYFVITDNRRIGFDFSLTLTHAGEKVPMSEKELKNRIGSGGEVVNSQREYMELVNRHIFGFQSTDAYEDLIKLLIQLRSPKLSKDFKPTVIYEILESALPPLTDDEIRYLSDSIDHMDQAQQELERLANQKKSIEKVLRVYDRYNRYIIAEKAEKWQSTEKKVAVKERTVHELQKNNSDMKVEISELEQKEEQLSDEQEILEKQKDELNRHEVWSLEAKKKDLEKESSRKKESVLRLEQSSDRKHKDYVKKKDELGAYEESESKAASRVEDLLAELEELAVECDFSPHTINQADFERMEESLYDFTVWKKAVLDHQDVLSDAMKLLEDRSRQQDRYSELERESSTLKQKVDEILQQMDHTEEWFIEEQQKLESAIFSWMGGHDSLFFTDEQRQNVARSVQGLYEENSYEQVKGILLNNLDEYREEVRTQFLERNNRLKTLEELIQEKDRQISQLKQQKMIEPKRSEGTSSHRERLKEEGVAGIPFYEAVEFQDGVPEDNKSRIEAVLKQTGILDSLITADEIKPTEDAVLIPEPLLMAQTLADYLKPDVEGDSAVSNQKVDDILRSIPLEESAGGFVIDTDGSFTYGIIRGHAPEEGPSKFIGRTSRKRYLKEQMALLLTELADLNEDRDGVMKEISRLSQIIEDIKEWQHAIPSDHVLLDIRKHYEQLEKDRTIQQALLDQTDRQWKDVQVTLSRLKQQLYDFSSRFSFELNMESVPEALKLMKEYEGNLNTLENAMVQLQASRQRIHDLARLLHEIEEELDHLKGEINVEQGTVDKLEREMESIEHQLALKGVDEIRREIRRVQENYEHVKSELKRLSKAIPEKAADLKRVNVELEREVEDMEFWVKMRDLWKQHVAEEIHHQFVEVDLNDAEHILSVYGDVLTTYDKPKIQEQLSKAFFEEQHMLSEYRMTNYTEEKELPEWMNEEQDERFEAIVKEYSTLKDRRMIRFSYNGSQVNPYYLAEILTKTYEEQERNLDDQDRKLYEDIMLNHIGTILRSRIKRAAKWVREMDKIMSVRDNSSGLIFSIAWKAQTAESEEEMDTAELVSLLERDSKHLHEDDLSKITRHFQSRIAKAKELITLRNEGSTLHQVLKEVLDYRKWFTFVLSYKRENEGIKRELTNNAFFQFSGGEKAMAMYIPLFTAAYSRYKEAGDFAPYIISLDEAFAGVDENNIRDMFEVIEQLGFNYIMNSQALWGDYDTVPSLSIADLLRPKNADFVTVMRYEWDGVQRKPVHQEEEEIYERLELT